MSKITTTRAYKFRMEPTAEQRKTLLVFASADRTIWNLALDCCQRYYATHKKGMPKALLSAELQSFRDTRPWMQEIDSQCVQQPLRKLWQAYENHFNPNMRAGFPKFKTKKNLRQSFRIPQRCVVKNGKIYVPKIGWIKIRQSEEVENTKAATFKQTATGKWFVTLTTEFEMLRVLPKVTPDAVVGHDLGLIDYITPSNTDAVPVPKFFRVYAKKLRRTQRQFSRRVKGSKNRQKAKIKVAIVYEKIRNLRGNFIHQLTHKLMANPANGFEDLNIKSLAKTKLAKSMCDAAFGEFLRQMKYKSLWNNNHFVQVNRFFPSSQLCSTRDCDYRNKDLQRSDREWGCPKCGVHHKRDKNASDNLKSETIRILDALGYMESLNDCGQDVSLAKASSLG